MPLMHERFAFTCRRDACVRRTIGLPTAHSGVSTSPDPCAQSPRRVQLSRIRSHVAAHPCSRHAPTPAPFPSGCPRCVCRPPPPMMRRSPRPLAASMAAAVSVVTRLLAATEQAPASRRLPRQTAPRAKEGASSCAATAGRSRGRTLAAADLAARVCGNRRHASA